MKVPNRSTRTSIRTAGTVLGSAMALGTAVAVVAWWGGQSVPTKVEPVAADLQGTRSLPTPDPVALKGPRTPVNPQPETPSDVQRDVERSEATEIKPPVRIAVDDDRPTADHLAEAENALAVGELVAGYTALRRHLRYNPETFEVLLRVGRLARELDDLDVSRAALQRATKIAPEEVEGHLQLARTELEGGKPNLARSSASTAVRLSPSESSGWNLLGRAEMAESRWEAAELAFDRSIDLDPANPYFYNNRGLLLVYMKRGADAVDALETAVELFGEDIPHYVLNNLGLAFELDNRFEAARGAFEEALSTSPFYVKARVNLRRVDKKLAEQLEVSMKEVADGSGATALTESEARASDSIPFDEEEDVAVDLPEL